MVARLLILAVFLVAWTSVSFAEDAAPVVGVVDPKTSIAIDDFRRKFDCGVEDPGARPLTEKEFDCAGEVWAGRIRELVSNDPVADAARQSGKGDFRFVTIVGAWSGPSIPGLACTFDPPNDMIRGGLFFSDAIGGPGDRLYRGFAYKYVGSFNQSLVLHRDYSFKDQCRPRTEADPDEWHIYQSIDQWKKRSRRVGTAKYLLEAARLGEVRRARALLRKGIDVNVIGKWGFTPLGWASVRGDTAMVRLLVNKGADPNFGDEYSSTVLNLAIAGGRDEIVQLLIDASADVQVESENIRNTYEELYELPAGYPLVSALNKGNVTMVRSLLAAGADPNYGEAWGAPIFSAIEANQTDNVTALIAAGGKPTDVLKDKKFSPIQAAAEFGSDEIVALLMDNGAAADARGAFERHTWRLAFEQGHEQILRHLIAFGANLNLLKSNEQSELLEAISSADLAVVRRLTGLADGYEGEMYAAMKKGDLEKVKRVFTSGASLAEGRKKTALHRAVDVQQHEIVDYLLSLGASPDVEVSIGNLEWLRTTDQTRDKMESQRRVTLQNKTWEANAGDTAMEHAFQIGPMSMIRKLLFKSDATFQSGPNFHQSIIHSSLFGHRRHKDIEIVELAMTLRGLPKKSGRESDLFLAEVCDWLVDDDASLLNRFLKKGYRPRQTGEAELGYEDGFWPVQPAMHECMSQSAQHVMLLLNYGGDPNQGVGSGSVLEELIEPRYDERNAAYLELLTQLLEMGADPNALNAYNNATVLDTAIRQSNRRQEEVASFNKAAVVILRKYGAKTHEQLVEEGVVPPREKPIPLIPVK